MTASDAPVVVRGLRTRSGNAMQRTRSAILAAAEDCVATLGVRRTTMSEIAVRGGVAKATLYNHFRTKDDVLAALVLARALALAAASQEAAAGRGPAAALGHTAEALRSHPALRRVATDEPAALLPLLTPGESAGWQSVREALVEVLGGEPRVDPVLRWLLSQLLWPVDEPERAAAQLLGAEWSAARTGRETGSTGLGWPG